MKLNDWQMEQRARLQPLRFRYLTSFQRSRICNGCGSKGGGAAVPDFLFTASCDQQYFYYWRGGSSADRETADREFYEAMQVDVKRAGWWRRPWLHWVAWIYFRGVRRWGADYFTFLPVKRGWLDLERWDGS
jgi:hypothetical protein